MTLGDLSASTPEPRNRAERRSAAKGTRRRKAMAVATGASIVAGSLVFATPASAAGIVVTSGADDGGGTDLTLREAVALANGNGTADVITFAPTVTSVVLAQGQLLVTEALRIDGPGVEITPAAATTNNFERALYASSADLTLSAVTISGFHSTSGRGGAVLARNADLTLTDVEMADNHVGAGRNGGAVYFQSGGDPDALTISGSAFSENRASSGGAVSAWVDGGSSAEIIDSSFTDNEVTGTGGAVKLGAGDASTLSIVDSTLERNHSLGTSTAMGEPSGGGGAYVFWEAPATLTVSGTTFDANTAVVDGGGLLLASYADAPAASITNTTVSGNSAGRDGGGLAQVKGTAVLSFSTVTGNTATGDGDGIVAASTAFNSYDSGHSSSAVAYNEATFNDAAYSATYNDATVSLANSIVAGNGTADVATRDDASSDGAPLAYATATIAATHTLIGTNYDDVVGDSGNIFGDDPELGELADNGGPTWTHLPADTSPVVDGAEPGVTSPATDQRGWLRVHGARADMGAVEVQPDPTTTTTTPAPSTPAPTPTTAPPTTTPPATVPPSAPPVSPSAPSGGSSPVFEVDGKPVVVPLPPSAPPTSVTSSVAVSPTESIAVTGDGRVFTTNPSDNRGGIAPGNHLNGPIVGLGIHWTRKVTPAALGAAATEEWEPSGYWLLGADGGIFSFGSAVFHGSTGNLRLNRPVVSMVPTPSGNGYWLVAGDGGVFNFGDAGFFGSTGNLKLAKPVVSMVPSASGRGYWLIASDGGVFNYGDAKFFGSAAKTGKTFVGALRTTSGLGYWLLAADGTRVPFGDAD